MRTGAILPCFLGVLALITGCAKGSEEPDIDPTAGASFDGGQQSPGAPDAGVTDPVGSPGAVVQADSGDTVAGDATVEDAPSIGPSGGSEAGDDAGSESDGASGPDAGSVVPTSCAEADNAYGCCVGNDLYYCDGSTSVTKKTCTSSKVCGWMASKTYYDCVAAPGGSDPSGTYPIACQ